MTLYGFEVSEGMVSDITDKLLPKIEELQNSLKNRGVEDILILCSDVRWTDRTERSDPDSISCHRTSAVHCTYGTEHTKI